MENNALTLEVIPTPLSVCKVADYSRTDLSRPFTFIGKTDGENSLVCPTDALPDNVTARSDGWSALRVRGTLDFSLVGILSRLSSVLADAGVGIFAVSTFDTDYILVRAPALPQAVEALRKAGFEVAE